MSLHYFCFINHSIVNKAYIKKYPKFDMIDKLLSNLIINEMKSLIKIFKNK